MFLGSVRHMGQLAEAEALGGAFSAAGFSGAVCKINVNTIVESYLPLRAQNVVCGLYDNNYVAQ